MFVNAHCQNRESAAGVIGAIVIIPQEVRP